MIDIESWKTKQEIGTEAASAALNAHTCTVGIDDRNRALALADLVTDLRHYADDNGIDFFEILDKSYQYYLEEKRGN